MPCTRHIIICEGESEWVYLQRLQSFFERQPLPANTFEPPLRLVAPQRVVVKSGSFGKLKSRYNSTRRENKKSSIQVWADFDLYHRNDQQFADLYAEKSEGIPDFLFSDHNFHDFFALHWDGNRFQDWLHFGNQGHFAIPLHADGYLPEIQRIFPEYHKSELPADFVTCEALKNLKQNRAHQPRSNPRNLQGLGSFADFLIAEIEKAYPGNLDPLLAFPAVP